MHSSRMPEKCMGKLQLRIKLRERISSANNSLRDDVARRSQAIRGSFGSGSGSIGAYSFSQSGYEWATAFGFSFDERNRIYGAATMVGDKNTIIEAVYSVDRQSLHGHGVARDNQGGRYKLHF
jgi:hypothetical protein